MNIDSSSMELHQDLAKHLFNDGAVLVIAGVPLGTELGIDMCSYNIGHKFRGIKMIPPGPHYIFCASKGSYGDIAPRVGFVHFFKSKEIVVREWDSANEELRERQIADPELEKNQIRDNLIELDRFLAPYDYRFLKNWKFLTDTITEQTIIRCRPSLGTIRTNVELQSCSDEDRPRGSQNKHSVKLIADENDLLPNLKPLEGRAMRFTVVPQRIPKDIEPAEISIHCMDCIAALNFLVHQFTSPSVLIEEIQLSFIFFLIGYSIDSLTQWRKVLHLMAHSQTAVEQYKIIFMKYSEVLSHQLPYLPEELMEPKENNTVFKDIRSLLINMNMGGLGFSAERLSKQLLDSMKWDFKEIMDEDPDEMPIVVETEYEHLST